MFRRPKWIEFVIAGNSLIVLAYVNLAEVGAWSPGISLCLVGLPGGLDKTMSVCIKEEF